MSDRSGIVFTVGVAVGGDTALNAGWNEPIRWVTHLSDRLVDESGLGLRIHFHLVIPGWILDSNFEGSRLGPSDSRDGFVVAEIALPEAAPPAPHEYLLGRLIESVASLSQWATRSGHSAALARIVRLLEEQLAALSPQPGSTPAPAQLPNGDANVEEPDAEGRVIVSFTGSESEFPVDWIDRLGPTETAAIAAIERARLGTIEGNEIGDNSYELTFVGNDGLAIWAAIKPTFDLAPVRWSRVEIRRSLEDPSPTVIDAPPTDQN